MKMPSRVCPHHILLLILLEYTILQVANAARTDPVQDFVCGEYGAQQGYSDCAGCNQAYPGNR